MTDSSDAIKEIDDLLFRTWAQFAQLTRARYLLTGELPTLPDWLQDDEALKAGKFNIPHS